MRKMVMMGASAFVAILVLGGAVLAVWDLPAPTKTVEKVIPDARLPK